MAQFQSWIGLDLQLKVNTVEILKRVGDRICIHVAKKLPRKRKCQFCAKKKIKVITKASSWDNLTQIITHQ